MNNFDYLEKYYDASIDRIHDEYNERGVNVSSQKRRQSLVEWTKVIYKKHNKN